VVVFLALLYRPRWSGVLALFVTVSVLVLLLGLNISILGLVRIERGKASVLVETSGLLVALTAAYAGGVLLLGRRRLGVTA
jgi:hypothetical protein